MNCRNDRKILSEVEAACLAVNEAAQRVLPGMPGLANYYESRLELGEMLTEPERFLLIYIATMFAHDTKVVEIAAGAAQLSVALSLLGFTQLCAIEINIERAFMANRLWLAVSSGNANIIHGLWQESDELLRHHGPALLVTWNAVSSQCSKDDDRDAKAFRLWWEYGGDIILCPGLYGEQDAEPMPIHYGKPLPYGLFHYRR